MGNGEQFYGRRAIRRIGEQTDIQEYQGYGFSDRKLIDRARAIREERRMKREAESFYYNREYDEIKPTIEDEAMVVRRW